MNPRIVSSSSAEVRGTSRATISRVTAKPKTASERPSSREISRLRQRNSCGFAVWRSASFSRSIPASSAAEDTDLFQIRQILLHLGQRQRTVDGGEIVPDLPRRAPSIHEVQGLIGVVAAPQARPLEQGRRGNLL